jgi:diguanylate cyclase (GGDEF)-like protein
MWKVFLLIGLPATFLFLLHPNLVVESVLVRVLGVYACIGIWTGLVRAQPQPRWGWRLFAVGALVNVTGDFFYTQLYYLNSTTLDPTLGVFIYGFGIVCSLGGLGLIIFPLRYQITSDSLIQGMIITTGFFSLIWLVQIGPSLDQSKDLFEWMKDAGIPLGLMTAIALCCIFMATPTGRTQSFRFAFLACLLFVLGAFLQAIGTTGWPTPFATNSPSDLVYLSDMSFALAYLTLATAFLHPSVRTFQDPPSRPYTLTIDDIALLGVAFFLTPAAFLVKSLLWHSPTDAIFVIGSSLIIFSLVMIRLASLMRILELQNQQLNLQHQDLHQMAFHDALTGLPNRTFLDNYLEHALQRTRRDQLGAALMMDLNHFKAINDTFGHHVGDEVLCEIARQLTDHKRHNDVVGRWGGDEFIFVIEGLNSERDARIFAERLSSQVRASRQRDGVAHTVSLSIGICFFPTDGQNVQMVVKHADQALYQAKASSKDTVAMYAGIGNQSKSV